MAAIKLPADFPRDYMIEGIIVDEDSRLGEGAYGVVKLAKYHGLTVAVKKLLPNFFPAGVDMKRLDDEAQVILESFFNECSKLSKIRHPNVIQLLGITVDAQTRLPAIVMELMHESLTRLLRRSSLLPLCTEIDICHDVAKGLAYLHSAFTPPIVHRDLSSNNILISQDYHAKVTDLGVSKFEASSFFQRLGNTPAPGTMAYMAPEVRKIPADCSPAMDVFAFGVIVVQVRSHKFPNPSPEYEKTKFGLPKSVSEVDRRQKHIRSLDRNHPLRSIALDCLKNNPKGRPLALNICTLLERTKQSTEYEESKLACQIQDGEADRVRERLSTLQSNLDQARGDLLQTNADVQRLCDEVEQYRRENAALKAQLSSSPPPPLSATRTDDPAAAIQQVGPEASPSSKSHSNFFKKPWRKKRSSRKPESSQASSHHEDVTSSSGDECNRSMESGFEIVSQRSGREAQQLIDIDTLKRSTFSWTSHRCLREGLQGVTLRAHRTTSRIYLCGGATGTGQPNTNIYYCPRRNITRWLKASVPAPQYYYSSVIIKRELVLIGGISTATNHCTRQLSTYDFVENMWTEKLPPLPTARSSSSATLYGDNLFVMGGIDDYGHILDTVEVLCLSRRQWTTLARLPIPLAGATAITYKTRIVLLCGLDKDGALSRRVFSFSPDQLLTSSGMFARLTKSTSSLWQHHSDCPYTVMAFCLCSNHLFGVGGIEKTASVSQPAEWLWRFGFLEEDSEECPRSNWTLVAKLHTARKLCCVVAMSSTTLAVIGGNPYYSVLDIAEVASPTHSK